jgi:predicted nucleic acid-binding protein
MVYAVIDTNVLVSAIFAVHPDSATVIVREKIMDGTIVPLYNAEIFDEIALSKEGSYLVTGNTKHFPATPIVVTPAELLRILEAMD